ncbi:bis(5'-nucleosyl)-tetraphosphatase (symmetrical) YqeK [Anaerolentibacter hominis]|uniref:bis(5'-nucleosyl)-tetraphosphatase (symmetrical) YqeK n=1 Tax=Anaerolentibacter hominis TaxID=3079009 RepID=UPI0031B8AF19
MAALTQLQEKVKNKITDKRFRHTLGVRYTAANIAMRYGADLIKAQTAALLHDYAKCLTDKELLSECRRYGLSISDIERRNPYLLHGKLAACYGAEEFSIEDEEILSAVTWHTTGRPGMSLMEKIIFVADYMEPERKMIPGLVRVRSMTYLDLDETVYLIYENMLNYLSGNENGQEKEIDPISIEAYDYYRKIHDKRKE